MEGVQDHIGANTEHEVNVVRANKTFLGMVENRGMWPSAAHRQCSSDLKRGQIDDRFLDAKHKSNDIS